MSVGGRIRRAIVSQFMHPRGLGGSLAGWEMALRSSNRRRNAWAIGMLDIRPTDRVLEIGCGPGIAVREASRRATDGLVVGLDHSATMVKQATRRNRRAVKGGRVRLVNSAAEQLPTFEHRFDAVIAVNNMGMWRSPTETLTTLRGLLTEGGRIAIVSQPRGQGATAETTAAAGRDIERTLVDVGFTQLESHVLDLKPPVVCVLGRRG